MSENTSDDKKGMPGQEVALLAAGCFWGVEEILRSVSGVVATEVGYTGGSLVDPTYHDVVTGQTGHAEAVRITFDPATISYAEILEYFFRLHDPTTKNRQGNDVGTQYRSAIFYRNDSQKQTALEVRDRVNASGKWSQDVVTEIVAEQPFYSAEDYHQDYLRKNPGGYSCHYLRD
jgi:peptide methionine sulfoxide reductase msrA/msrB